MIFLNEKKNKKRTYLKLHKSLLFKGKFSKFTFSYLYTHTRTHDKIREMLKFYIKWFERVCLLCFFLNYILNHKILIQMSIISLNYLFYDEEEQE